MTREEQIRNKARELGQQYFPDSANIWARSNVEAAYVENACVEMAEWVERHPRWIPVEEERPKVSGDYIICEKRGFVKEAHYFELDDLWMLPGGALVSPTHWMQLPVAQGKEE